jgi:hypothetical protein
MQNSQRPLLENCEPPRNKIMHNNTVVTRQMVRNHRKNLEKKIPGKPHPRNYGTYGDPTPHDKNGVKS